MIQTIVLSAVHAQPYRQLMLEAYEEPFEAFTATVEERAAEPEAFWIKRITDTSLTFS